MEDGTFAEQQMLKYGWSEGKGLGKNEDGNSEPLRAKLKFDKQGIGHDVTQDLCHNWWDNVFNNALESVGKDDEELKELEKKEKKKKKTYSNFVKTGEISDSETPETYNTLATGMVNICEGRTAHKGARHGVYSNGKIERTIKADEEFLKQLSNKTEKITIGITKSASEIIKQEADQVHFARITNQPKKRKRDEKAHKSPKSVKPATDKSMSAKKDNTRHKTDKKTNNKYNKACCI